MEHLFTLGLAALFFGSVVGTMAAVFYILAKAQIDHAEFAQVTQDWRSLKTYLKGRVGKA